MHFLADENLPQTIIKYFKKEGHFIIDIKKENPTVSDRNLIALAGKSIILTCDKDFLHYEELREGQVIIFDFPRTKPNDILPYLPTLIKYLEKNHKSLPQKFLVVFRKEGLFFSSSDVKEKIS